MTILDTCKTSVFYLVNVAEQAGMSLTWSESVKTGFSCNEVHTIVQ